MPEALHQLRRDRDVAWAEVARLRALLRRKKRPAAISALPYGVAERRSSFSPSPPPAQRDGKRRGPAAATAAGRGRGGKGRGGRKADAGAAPRAAAPSPAAPKYSPVAVDAPAPASFAAVVAAPAPAREHKSS